MPNMHIFIWHLLQVNTEVKTLQLDLLSGTCVVNWKRAELFFGGSLVWQSVEALSVNFADAAQHDLRTGFAAMLALLPDSDVNIDQFIVRFLGKVSLIFVNFI